MSIPPVLAADTAERVRWHLGGLLTIRAAATDTNGSLGVVEERAVRDYATPPHVHTREDETLFVIRGRLKYVVNGVSGTANAGDAVFLPRNLSHHFQVISDDAHFLILITPGGFERFFLRVSPAAKARQLPGANERPYTDPDAMVREAAVLGTTVFRGTPGADNPAVVAAKVAGAATDPAEVAQAYRTVEDIVTRVTQPLSGVDLLITELADIATRRLRHDIVHARSVILLGILAERADRDFGGEVTELLTMVEPGTPEATVLALAYLFCHFPSQKQAVTSAFLPTLLPEQDRQRLLRCVEQPDFTGRQPARKVGRVWPSPATWILNDSERELDQQWRSMLQLDSAAVRDLWTWETEALRAFMGAKAAYAVERSIINA